MPSYDPQNIFAKILRGELPCYKVYEDDKVLAFLDIMPRAPGHTLVLPKAPARNLLDVDPADLAHVMQAAQKIAKAAGNEGRIRRFDVGKMGDKFIAFHASNSSVKEQLQPRFLRWSGSAARSFADWRLERPPPTLTQAIMT